MFIFVQHILAISHKQQNMHEVRTVCVTLQLFYKSQLKPNCFTTIGHLVKSLDGNVESNAIEMQYKLNEIRCKYIYMNCNKNLSILLNLHCENWNVIVKNSCDGYIVYHMKTYQHSCFGIQFSEFHFGFI